MKGKTMTRIYNKSPTIIKNLINERRIPPRLLAHLTLVYEVAKTILAWMDHHYPGVSIDKEAVLFGAVTHDIGKVMVNEEITKPGSTHERQGFELLLNHGIKEHLARFTLTHSQWTTSNTNIDDWMVSLADKIWKGKRVTDLEDLIVNHICRKTNKEKWEVFLNFDDLLQNISKDADKRLAFQTNYHY
jgi:hypothetical protein